MPPVIRAFLLSLPLAYLFNVLFWLLVPLVLWDANALDLGRILGAEHLAAESALDLVWPAVVWLLAFAQCLAVGVPLPVTAAPAGASALLPRVALAAVIGGLVVAVPALALVDVAYYLPSVNPQNFNPQSCILGGFLLWALSWAFWIPVLLRRSQGDPDALERFVGRSVKGSAVGLALCLPWYYVLRRKQACHCGLGTFIALAAGLWSLLVVGGPLLLLLARERRLRAAGR